MGRHRFLRGLKFLPFAALFVTVFGFIVMRLWNWLMPSLFGWHMITFWQGLGLLVLCKILFGGFRGRPGGPMHWRHRTGERWQQMTPEERDKFRQAMRSRCGSFGRTAAEPKA